GAGRLLRGDVAARQRAPLGHGDRHGDARPGDDLAQRLPADPQRELLDHEEDPGRAVEASALGLEPHRVAGDDGRLRPPGPLLPRPGPAEREGAGERLRGRAAADAPVDREHDRHLARDRVPADPRPDAAEPPALGGEDDLLQEERARPVPGGNVTIPNVLTILRLIAVPVFLYASLRGHFTLAFVLFVSAAFTDVF